MGMEYLNDPVTTLMIGASGASDSVSLLTCDYCRTRLLQAMKAHVALSQFEQAAALADRVRLLVRRPGELFGPDPVLHGGEGYGFNEYPYFLH